MSVLLRYLSLSDFTPAVQVCTSLELATLHVPYSSHSCSGALSYLQLTFVLVSSPLLYVSALVSLLKFSLCSPLRYRLVFLSLLLSSLLFSQIQKFCHPPTSPTSFVSSYFSSSSKTVNLSTCHVKSI